VEPLPRVEIEAIHTDRLSQRLECAGGIALLLAQIGEQVVSLRQAGLTPDDVGEYLFRDRLRSEVAASVGPGDVGSRLLPDRQGIGGGS
jgi:hypothetical protein